MSTDSVGVPLAQDLEERLDQNPHIEPKAPIVNVPKIEFDAP